MHSTLHHYIPPPLVQTSTKIMKHYRAKPSAQLSKLLQDDIKHAVMKLELE